MQFETDDHRTAFATKIFQIRSIDGLKDAKIPEDKLLETTAHSPAPAASPSSDPQLAGRGFMDIPDGIDEELPFM